MIIQGLQIIPLKVISDERGRVLHMLRSDAAHFLAFGEIYFSTVRQWAVKGWRKHQIMTMNLAVPIGRIRLVAYDDRKDSATLGQVMDLVIGESDYNLVVVPPGVWTASQGLAKGESLIANCSSILHGSEHVEACNLDEHPCKVDWSLR